jgi:hypothetical protein
MTNIKREGKDLHEPTAKMARTSAITTDTKAYLVQRAMDTAYKCLPYEEMASEATCPMNALITDWLLCRPDQRPVQAPASQSAPRHRTDIQVIHYWSNTLRVFWKS